MAEFKVTIKKYSILEYRVKAKDKIDAVMIATQQAVNNLDLSGDDQYEVIQISPVIEPAFHVNESVYIKPLQVNGTIMKCNYSNMDNDFIYKVLHSDANLGTFYESQLSSRIDRTVHD